MIRGSLVVDIWLIEGAFLYSNLLRDVSCSINSLIKVWKSLTKN